MQWFAFAAWIAYGLIQARRWPALRAKMQAMCPVQRKVYAPLLMFGGAALLLVGLFALSATADPNTQALSPISWLGVTLLGLIFVHAQTMATLMIVSLINQPSTASGTSQGNNTDEASSPPPA